MDPRLLSVVFLLMAGVLPLRELTAKWVERPERRGAVRALWIAYLLLAVSAIAALVFISRQETRSISPPADGSEQLVRLSAACAGEAPRA